MQPDAGTVWIDDPNLIFRRGIAACLSAEGFTIAGESAGFDPAPRLDGVAILLFDIEGCGLQPAVQAARSADARVVGIGKSGRDDLLFDAVQAGLAGFLVKNELTPATLVGCLRAVASGQSSLPPALVTRLFDSMAKGGPRGASVGALASRELDVLRLLADGGDTKEIASELSYSERTVKNIVHDVLVKTNCKTRAQAVAVATRQGFI
jgi:DNA-binding NarL/FixJ family response regulator